MSFFILPQRATLLKRLAHNPNLDRSGQLVKPEHEATGDTIKCLFYGMVGGKRSGPRQEFDQTVAFYCEPHINIEEGDLIKNVRGLDGFETGEFEVLRVTKVTSYTGKVHHQSCKLRGGAQ